MIISNQRTIITASRYYSYTLQQNGRDPKTYKMFKMKPKYRLILLLIIMAQDMLQGSNQSHCFVQMHFWKGKSGPLHLPCKNPSSMHTTSQTWSTQQPLNVLLFDEHSPASTLHFDLSANNEAHQIGKFIEIRKYSGQTLPKAKTSSKIRRREPFIFILNTLWSTVTFMCKDEGTCVY